MYGIWDNMVFTNGLIGLLLCGIILRLYHICLTGEIDAYSAHQQTLLYLTEASDFLTFYLPSMNHLNVPQIIILFVPVDGGSWVFMVVGVAISIFFFGLDQDSILHGILTQSVTRWNKPSLPVTNDSKDKLRINWNKRRNRRLLKLICVKIAKYSLADALNVACMCTLAYNEPEVQRLLAKGEGWHLLTKLGIKMQTQIPFKDISHKSYYCLVLGDTAPEKSSLYKILGLGVDVPKIRWYKIPRHIVTNVDFNFVPGVLYLETLSVDPTIKNVVVLSTLDKNSAKPPLCFFDEEKCQKEHYFHRYFFVNINEKEIIPGLKTPVYVKRGPHAGYGQEEEWWKTFCKTEDMYYDFACEKSPSCNDIVMRVESISYDDCDNDNNNNNNLV